MFLTKMPINPRRRAAHKLMSSPQALHAAVMAGFADARPTDEGRVLWRLDVYDLHRVVLFVASPDQPDFTHLVEQAGWPTTQTWTTRPYDPLLESLRAGPAVAISAHRQPGQVRPACRVDRYQADRARHRQAAGAVATGSRRQCGFPSGPPPRYRRE